MNLVKLFMFVSLVSLRNRLKVHFLQNFGDVEEHIAAVDQNLQESDVDPLVWR